MLGLGVLCARLKPWNLTLLSLAHGSAHHRLAGSPASFASAVTGAGNNRNRRHHSSACGLGSIGGGAASIWHAILPSGGDCRNNIWPAFHHEHKGEGSWNAAWDVRPARWLHGSDSAWLLFGVCGCLAPFNCAGNLEPPVIEDGEGSSENDEIMSDGKNRCFLDYRVIGVTADGRCLFRAVAHGSCLKNGEEAPDENRQRELADDLRARVADELLKRREETEWFIEGDFDMYLKNIQQPNAWGGEPELLMASHVLKAPVSVYMIDRSSGGLINIASYGQEYGKQKESPIMVLFHGYGHYDVVETLSDRH